MRVVVLFVRTSSRELDLLPFAPSLQMPVAPKKKGRKNISETEISSDQVLVQFGFANQALAAPRVGLQWLACKLSADPEVKMEFRKNLKSGIPAQDVRRTPCEEL